MADRDIGRAEEQKAKQSAWLKVARKIREEWRRTGYDPVAHLRSISASGDPDVLYRFMQDAHNHHYSLGRPLTLGMWLGHEDMREVRLYARAPTSDTLAAT